MVGHSYASHLRPFGQLGAAPRAGGSPRTDPSGRQFRCSTGHAFVRLPMQERIRRWLAIGLLRDWHRGCGLFRCVDVLRLRLARTTPEDIGFRTDNDQRQCERVVHERRKSPQKDNSLEGNKLLLADVGDRGGQVLRRVGQPHAHVQAAHLPRVGASYAHRTGITATFLVIL